MTIREWSRYKCKEVLHSINFNDKLIDYILSKNEKLTLEELANLAEGCRLSRISQSATLATLLKEMR